MQRIFPRFTGHLELSPEMTKKLSQLATGTDASMFKTLAQTIEENKQAIASLPDCITLQVTDSETVQFRLSDKITEELSSGVLAEVRKAEDKTANEEANIERGLKGIKESRRWFGFARKHQTPWGKVNIPRFVLERFFKEPVKAATGSLVSQAVRQAQNNWNNTLKSWKRVLATSEYIDSSVFQRHASAEFNAVVDAFLSPDVQAELKAMPDVRFIYSTGLATKGPKRLDASRGRYYSTENVKAYYPRNGLIPRDRILVTVTLGNGKTHDLEMLREIRHVQGDRMVDSYGGTKGYQFSQEYGETPAALLKRSIEQVKSLKRLSDEEFRLLESLGTK